MAADVLNAALLAAHAAQDHAQIVALYARAADTAATIDEEMFFLTHAYIFALEAGAAEAAELRERLRAAGRID